jgi:hypothetical protein
MWREYEKGAEIPEQSWSTLRATDRCTQAMLPSRRDKHIGIPCHGTGRPIQARNVRYRHNSRDAKYRPDFVK